MPFISATQLPLLLYVGLQFSNALSYTVCDTPACRVLSNFIKTLVDTQHDPCQDFYNFSCGRWKAENKVPNGRLQYGVDSLSQERIDNVTLEALYAIDPKDKKRWGKAVRWARRFFANCQAYDKSEDSSQDEVMTYLKSFADWPFFNPRWNPADFDLVEVIGRMQRNLSLSTLLTVAVEPDQFHPDRYALYLKEGTFVAETTFFNVSVFPRFRERYLEIMAKTLNQLILDTGTSHLKVRNVKRLVREIYEFEESLANAVVPPGDQAGKDQKLYYNPMNISELDTLVNHSNVYQRYFTAVFGNETEAMNYMANNRVIVTQPDYLVWLHAKIASTPPHIPANYLMWRLLYDTLSEYVDGDYLKIEKIPREQRVIIIKRLADSPAIKQSMAYDHYRNSDKEQSCLYRTRKAYDFVVGRIYVDYQFSQARLGKATSLTNSIHNSFMDTLSKTPWLTSETRNRSMEKLQMLIKNVGYPDWIINDTILNDHYRYYKVRQNSTFFQDSLRLSFFDYRKLFEVGSRYDFGLSVSTARSAGYAQSLNAITIPAGQLEYPYFDPGFPDAYNYATVGYTVGHEISHGFDNIGVYFDGNGDTERSNNIQGPWLMEGVNDTFINLTQCLVDQYNNYCYEFRQVNKSINIAKGSKQELPIKVVEPAGKTTDFYCIDGTNTLSENFADLNGLRLAYKAYRSQASEGDVRLVGLEQFSPEQIFFLGYSAGWCRSATYGGLKLQLSGGDPHSPEDARVNVVLRNMPEFSAAFQCAKESPMGTKKICNLY